MNSTQIVPALMGIALSFCAAAAEVRTARDPDEDPSKYRVYAFVQGDTKDKGVISDRLVQHRLQGMVGRQLMDKGYTPAAPGQEAQLGVNISGHVVPKQRVFMTGRPGSYDYNWGRAELGGTRTLDYREGTLFVDIVDLSQGRLLWRAHISQAFTAGYSEENWKKAERAVAEAFKSLPPRR